LTFCDDRYSYLGNESDRMIGSCSEGARKSFSRLGAVLILSVLGGCGGGTADGFDRQSVSGEVVFAGKPLPHGYIQFQPTSENGVAAGGSITDGKFSIPKPEGPVAGDYKVLISSSEAATGDAGGDLPAPGAPTKPKPEPIPAKYNSASTLTQKIESGGENKFTFTLDAK